MKMIFFHIKRYLVILLLTIYFFVSSIYVLFLPGYNFSNIISNPLIHSSSVLNITHLRNDIDFNNSSVRIHRLCKSITEDKRRAIYALYLISSILTLLIVTNSIFRKPAEYLKLFAELPQHYYLKFCSIRI